MDAAQHDRAAGVLLGQAAGDALGAQYEFGPALSDEVVPQFGVGVFGHGVGEWTDDTSMAVAILQELAAGRSLDDDDTLGRIVATWQEWARDAKDVGTQTRGILSALPVPTADAAWAAAERAHRVAGRSGGNGSLMRTGPVALGYLDRPVADLVDAAGRVARLTHWETDNVDACALWCAAIRDAVLTGRFDMRTTLSVVPTERRARWTGIVDEALAAASHPRDFREQNGWVVRAFQGALAAVAHAESLPDALYRAVRGGGDTDTVAAIAGALAGAVWGASAVPDVWRRMLHGWPGIDGDELVRMTGPAAQA